MVLTQVLNGTGGLIYNTNLLKLLFDKGLKTNIIILQLDAYPYFINDDANLAREIATLYPFLDENDALSKSINQDARYEERMKLWLHSYRFNGKLLNILYNQRRGMPADNFRGFSGLTGIIDSFNMQQVRISENEKPLSERKIAALGEICSLCKTNAVRLAIVMPPSYQNCIYDSSLTQQILKKLKENAVEEIYDLSDITQFPELRAASFWRDATHLNAGGAQVFSELLNQRMATRRAGGL